jgi:phospholipase/carboxylesterase
MRPQSRREFLHRLAAASAISTVLPTLAACGGSLVDNIRFGGGSSRLTARPRTPSVTTKPGTYPVTPDIINNGVLVVPSKYDGSPMPLVLGLHGAGMLASSQVSLLGSHAEARGFLLLAIGSRGVTWDVFSSKFSYDVKFIDQILAWAFERVSVDPTRVVVEGFSDGASYALGLALTNGDLFTRAVAFSPGFIPNSDSEPVGKAKIFDSHGVNDQILPIDNASRRIVADLKSRGYSVEYVEFTGGHTVTADVAAAAVNFIMA